MIRLFALAMLMCALVVPRAAWAEHVGQHGQSVTSSQDHVHHNVHTHVVDATDAEHGHDPAPSEAGDGGDNEGDFKHNHLAADVLSVGAEPSSNPALDTPPLRSKQQTVAPLIAGAPSSPLGSILRPPRTL